MATPIPPDRQEHEAPDRTAILDRLEQLTRDLDAAYRTEWVAAERLRIAQDLHDRLAQTLFGMGLAVDWLLAQTAPDAPLRPDLERVKAMAATSLRQVREAIFSLSAAPVEGARLRAAVAALLAELERGGIGGSLAVDGDLQSLAPEVADALYQVVREALVNVRRHAGASFVLVSIRVESDEAAAVVQDDGHGLPPGVLETFRQNGAHLGLRGMQGRAERLGGTLLLAPGDECGLTVTVRLPLKGVSRLA